MATNNRDVKMTLSVETLGEEGIKQLQTSLRSLANSGGDAAPEFKRLADEIDRLGEQAGALRAFEALNAQVQAFGSEQVQTAQKVETLRAELGQAAAATDAARQSQASATTELKRNQEALAATNGELKILRNSYDESGKRVANYKSELLRLTTQQVAQESAIRSNRDAQREANDELKAAEQAQQKIVTSLGRQEKALGSLNNALQAQQGALREQTSAVEAFDLSTSDLSTSQAKLLQAINNTGQGAQRLAASLEEARAAEQQKAVQEAESLRLQQEKITAINNEIRFAQQSAAQRQALTDQQSATERKAAAERAAMLAKEQADETAAYNKRVADLNKEIAVRNQLAKERENAARSATVAEIAANDKARAEQDAADKAAFNKRLTDLNTEIKYRRQLASERETLAKQAADAEVAASLKSAAEQKAAAEKAVDAIAKAFNTAGAQSASGLRQQINDVRAAMDLLGNRAGLTGRELTTAMSAGNAKIKELERNLRAATGQMTLADKAAGLFSNSMGQITAGNLIADAVGYLVNKVKEMGRAFVDANIQLESWRRGLTAIYKDSGLAASQIDFLRKTATNAGVALGAIGDSFIRYAAATKSANIPTEQTNALFEAMVNAGARLGLSSERVALGIDAIGQMASKGVVSMEELRQQLGDSLPGALSLTAKGLGLTDAELVKLVESGGLLTRDLIPGLTKSLKELGGDVDGIVPAWSRLKNLLTSFAQAMGDAGATNVLTLAIKGLGLVMGTLLLSVTSLVEAFGLFNRTITLVAETVRGNGAEALKAFGAEAEKAKARLTGVATATLSIVDPQQKVTQALRETTTATTASGAALTALNATIAQSTTSNEAAVRVWLRAAIALRNLLTDTDAAILVYEKMVKATDDAAKAGEAYAKISGDEQLQLDNTSASLEKKLTIRNALLAVQQQEVDGLTLYIDQLKAAALALGDSNGERQKAIDTQQKLLNDRAADRDRTREQVEAINAEVAANQIKRAQLGDLSGALGTYRQALAEVKFEIVELTKLEQAGLDVSGEMAEARRREAEITGLLGNAVADATKKLELDTQLKSANLQITLAKVNGEKQHYEIMARNAQALGDYSAATYYQVQAKNAEIKAMQISLEIKKLEAEADIKSLEIKRAEIPLDDANRAAKLREIDIRIALQKVKLEEVKSGKELVAALEAEKIAMLNGTSNRSGDTASRREHASAIDRQASSLERLNAAQSKERTTSDGFKTNADGSAQGNFNSGVITDKAYQIAEKMRTGTLTLEDLPDVQAGLKQAKDAVAWLQAFQELNPAGVSQSAITSSGGLLAQMQRAMELLQGQQLIEKQRQSGSQNNNAPNNLISSPSAASTSQTFTDTGTPSPTPTAAPTPAPSRQTSTAAKTYNVQIGTATIRTASDADAQRLISVLKAASTAA